MVESNHRKRQGQQPELAPPQRRPDRRTVLHLRRCVVGSLTALVQQSAAGDQQRCADQCNTGCKNDDSDAPANGIGQNCTEGKGDRRGKSCAQGDAGDRRSCGMSHVSGDQREARIVEAAGMGKADRCHSPRNAAWLSTVASRPRQTVPNSAPAPSSSRPCPISTIRPETGDAAAATSNASVSPKAMSVLLQPRSASQLRRSAAKLWKGPAQTIGLRPRVNSCGPVYHICWNAIPARMAPSGPRPR